MQRVLIIGGAILIVAGLLWPWLARIPLGRLPGDLRVGGDAWSVSFPIVTCVVISVALSALLWLLRR